MSVITNKRQQNQHGCRADPKNQYILRQAVTNVRNDNETASFFHPYWFLFSPFVAFAHPPVRHPLRPMGPDELKDYVRHFYRGATSKGCNSFGHYGVRFPNIWIKI